MTEVAGASGGDDRTARARLRDAALHLFAEQGVDATSLRAIATEAGVSHGLLRHHFGAKEEVRAAVDSWVLERLAEAFGPPRDDGGPGSTADLLAERARRFEAFQLLHPDLLRYLGRVLVERSETASVFFARLTAGAMAELERLERQGHVRPTDDPEVRALLMVCLGLGPVVLRPLIESVLGDSLGSAEGLRRWFAGEVEVLQHGVYED